MMNFECQHLVDLELLARRMGDHVGHGGTTPRARATREKKAGLHTIA